MRDLVGTGSPRRLAQNEYTLSTLGESCVRLMQFPIELVTPLREPIRRGWVVHVVLNELAAFLNRVAQTSRQREAWESPENSCGMAKAGAFEFWMLSSDDAVHIILFEEVFHSIV